MRWQSLSQGPRQGLRLWFEDQGPGIPDIELALKDGWTSGKGLGVGLSGSRRLVNEFELHAGNLNVLSGLATSGVAGAVAQNLQVLKDILEAPNTRDGITR